MADDFRHTSKVGLARADASRVAGDRSKMVAPRYRKMRELGLAAREE
jgi:hypothetical protein